MESRQERGFFLSVFDLQQLAVQSLDTGAVRSLEVREVLTQTVAVVVVARTEKRVTVLAVLETSSEVKSWHGYNLRARKSCQTQALNL